ncbi:MAG TPA: ABC-2 family transporter protein [Burkholderiaceae bacterium]|nr:ABC-2 family transporter protein [Burkholderiaceae bacterium]
MTRLLDYLRLVWSYVRLNFAAQLEYRGAFVSQVVAMFINDLAWVAFWVLFFTRFPVLRDWNVSDVITIWAIATAGFGVAHAIYGNAGMIASLIAQGQIDVWMLYPRAVLPHLLLGRMSATALGDVLFGFAVYIVAVRPDLAHFALFTALVGSTAVLFVGFGVMAGSIGFYLGNATTLAQQWQFAMVTFSTYPATLFQGAVKVVLFTAVPALFINHYPVEALRSLSLSDAALAFLGSLGVLAAGVAVFHHGLRRYESGNLLVMRE